MSCPTDSSPWRLEWNDGLSVHIPEIDAEHQQFIRLVNELNEAVARRMDMDEIKKRLRAILVDSAAHFTHEENLFTEWGYPEAQEHAKKHEQIKRTLQGVLSMFEHGGLDYKLIEAGLKVKETLIDHLLTEDMKYRDYFLLFSRTKSKAENRT